ncbi:hypothetical protein J2Z69_002390 [Paenibacillus shirakamiensis]|uniref:DUF2642 domain-containing protein n=1 Tax=Paenibacillus shirakamiensis TaxID=1265935 RepID=A0ABS4JI22_9BACL|nr:hypothetical protein [Paenibacillus shirakamiensis]MBP2001347.1 hypothetical protein [Paenibacillus shirakamiensis]
MCFFGYGQLRHKVRHLIEEVKELTARLNDLEDRLSSGVFPNPAIVAYLQDKIGQSIHISTASASLEGILVTVATDALEIRESTGDLVLIPFSRITVLQ